MDPTAVIAVVGLITTAAAPIAQSLVAARHQDASRLRELRTALYADACLFAQHAQSVVDHYTDPEDQSGPRLHKPPPADGITARMRLLAEQDVIDSWLELLQADTGVQLMFHYDREIQQGKMLDWQDPDVQRFTKAVERFYEAARSAQLRPRKKARAQIEGQKSVGST